MLVLVCGVKTVIMIKCAYCNYKNNGDGEKSCIYCKRYLPFILDEKELYEVLKTCNTREDLVIDINYDDNVIKITFDNDCFIDLQTLYVLKKHYNSKKILFKGTLSRKTLVYIQL